ncbi:MAG: hypothetical protein NTW10_00825 [Bacteroidetes bacterium]|nr:hypothetical protein [Bacteroidota bacterium]
MGSFTSFSQTQYEFWPEINGFIRLTDQFRFYLVSSYAKGKESDVKTLDLAANIDVSLIPIFRTKKWEEDWQRSRFFWVRVGYDYIFKQVSDTMSAPENRGMINIFAKVNLPADIWLEVRLRTDLRWIGGVYSTRYRMRIEATREFAVFKHLVVPYLNCEVFYDTRYLWWSRILVMAGAEFTVNRHFRFELYLAPQFDYLPERTSLLAFGVVAKLYY